jgi:long-chain acyl-CoA synthetase
MINGQASGYASYEDALADVSDADVGGVRPGAALLYSSGTTGRPKGVEVPPPAPGEVDALTRRLRDVYGMRPGDVYLSPAPLYHSAPLLYSMCVHRLGGTVVVMESFDATEALALIEEHRVTHSQWVPTMFQRMLDLPAPVRDQYDLSSHRVAIHGAAPCPPQVKEGMLDWWGDIVYEYYAATERHGVAAISPQEWRAKPGSVGRAVQGTAHILDEQGRPLPPYETGTIYFTGGAPFRYHNDPDKTAGTRVGEAATVGDLGYIDEDGYLFIVDRRTDLVVSGGVNIYPREIELVLLEHEAVQDAAVFGVPNRDFGQEVKAVVEVGDDATEDLVDELIDHCRDHLASLKCPRSIDIVATLPRTPTGKLQKHKLREQYWPEDQQHAGALRRQ